MQEVEEQLFSTVKELFGIEQVVELTTPNESFGDYSTNIALQLAKKIGKNPREIATEVVNKLLENKLVWLKSATVDDPGFINIFVSDKFIFNGISRPINQLLADKIVIVEYSDPNTFKALHAGHLYTTLVGNAVANIMEAVGGKVYRLNYGGDVGLHVAKAMWGIVNKLGGEFPDKLQDINEQERPSWVSQCYVDGNNAYESSEELKQQIAIVNKKIYGIHTDNDRDSAFAQIYWQCRQWSYDGFVKLYQELEVNPFDEFIPESLVTPLGQKTVEEGLKNGIFEKSDGAVVYSKQKSGLHTRVFITSAGLPTYEAKELGLAVHKWQKYHFDKSLVITANDIAEYMKVLFSAMSNFYPEVEQRTTHLTHGIIKLAGGRKMSSRKGSVLMATEIIESAVQANVDNSGKNDKSIAIGAVKYAFLKQRVGGDIIYDPDESISLNGNSGPYLQYAHARAKSILNKANLPQNSPLTVDSLDSYERSLASKLGKFGLVVEKSATELTPHHICSYLYELAVIFNRFYENSKVVGDPREAIRVALVQQYANTLKNGLEILGIKAPNKM